VFIDPTGRDRRCTSPATGACPVELLVAAGVVGDAELAVEVGLIWLTHIGVDRAVGYGLKYPTGFKDTHLQRV